MNKKKTSMKEKFFGLNKLIQFVVMGFVWFIGFVGLMLTSAIAFSILATFGIVSNPEVAINLGGGLTWGWFFGSPIMMLVWWFRNK